jgi:tetratricopeptide (TPR) repeat protein
MREAAGACDEAMRQIQAGQPRRAEALLRTVLLDNIRDGRAYRLLAHAAHSQGRGLEADSLIGHAIALQPEDAEHHFIQGVVLMGRNKIEEAAEAFEEAVRLNPALAEARLNLGNARMMLKQLEQAVGHYRIALEMRPNMAEGHLNLGATLRAMRDFAGAEAAVRRALEINPALSGVHLNLGNALSEQGRFEEAVEAYRAHLAASPNDPGNWVALGANLAALGRREDCLEAYDQAVSRVPEDGTQRFERAVARLLFGDFEGGWEDYEHRWAKERLKAERPNLPGREWQGEDIAGKTLFVFGEQGYGDNIQFARYLPLLTERGAKVIFCSELTLEALFAPLAPAVQWFGGNGALPAYDYFVPLLSLPYHFQTRLETIPAKLPYLSVTDERRSLWKDRIAALEPGNEVKVGLVWTGRPAHGNDLERSLEPEMLAPLLQVPGARFFSLQKPSRPGHLEALNRLGHVHDLEPQLEDFADTAAALDNLDLLISVDTAVAHLAGALGRPAWVLVARQPDWRWLLNRDDSPWYPGMRLFRQTAKWDWASVIHRLADALTERVALGYKKTSAPSRRAKAIKHKILDK